MRLTNKTAPVTGGNSDIGRGIVHRFVREGASVAIAAREPDKGQAVVDEVADTVLFLANETSPHMPPTFYGEGAAARAVLVAGGLSTQTFVILEEAH